MKKENITSVLVKLLKLLKIPVTETSIKTELDKHPDQLTLFAINDLLNLWNVPNGAFNIESEALSEVPLPFIAHLSSNNGEFVVVDAMSTTGVSLHNEHWNSHSMSLDEFIKLFSGAVLIAQFEPDAGEINFKEKMRTQTLEKLKYPFLIAFSSIIVLSAVLQYSELINIITWQLGVLVFIKSAGLITSILLLIHSIDAGNSLTKRLCSGEITNCSDILTSKAAKITSFLSWSEVGLFYYVGTWITLLFNSDSVSTMQMLIIINILCLPYTFYSIYYQWRIAKQWCVLCSIIQALLWLEFCFSLSLLSRPFNIPLSHEIVNLVIAFAIPIFAWAFIKPLITRYITVESLNQKLKDFKYNSTLFQKVLTAQDKYPLLNENESIILGNVEAENIITIVSSPTCEPCSEAHKVLNEWLLQKDSFKLQLVFSVANEDSDTSTKVARHLHKLKETNESLLSDAVHEWFERKYKNVESWMGAYPCDEDINSTAAIEKHKSWCRHAKVQSTPTVFINGFQLPSPWELEDIKFFI